jgi:AraC family transcriptional regulator of adaptative response / DNA-3-methyladenine glycosylase II
VEEVAGLTRDVLDRARVSRDARFDGRFFIAVVTTRIYCRPICPTRLSHYANVRYYATADEAASAGFRPCLRCRPEAAPGSPAWSGTSAVVQRALRLIQDGALDHASLSHLATRLGIGVRHLSRLFKQHLGTSPAAVAQTRRLYFAKRLLDDTHIAITEIAHAAGFGSIRRFNDAFRDTFRRSPSELRKGKRVGTEASGGVTLRLSFRPPYDWERLLGFLAAHEIPGVEHVTDEQYRRAARTPSGHAIVQVRAADAANALEVKVKGALPAELPLLLYAVKRMFDLTADPVRILAAMHDPSLCPLLAERPGLRIAGSWDPFECCVCAIIELHRQGVRSRDVLKSLIHRFGTQIDSEDIHVNRLFPTAAVLASAKLDDLGLTATGSDALRKLSQCVHEKTIRFDSSSEEIGRALSALPGIGPSIVGYVQLRGLGEPDALPFGDLRLRRAASGGGVLLSASALEERAEAWRPFRGYAVFHLWTSHQSQHENLVRPIEHRSGTCL